ncbi:hypothetical protein MA16_Dca011043 [Dendrobium catenatum]|uniref:Uncharacterized protein n=2 Tax=Dendrobium catenatum TaxID=906689 RepID=A0A2I0WCI1_9ASPA|nr:hypothetical protein MA16_Dca011043 [Dendrobium catenatum]
MESSNPVVENGGDTSYEKLESMATWVVSSISSAFFASLDCFFCINLSTSDLDEDIEEEAKDLPLVHSAQNSSDYRSDEPSFVTNFTSEWAPTSD